MGIPIFATLKLPKNWDTNLDKEHPLYTLRIRIQDLYGEYRNYEKRFLKDIARNSGTIDLSSKRSHEKLRSMRSRESFWLKSKLKNSGNSNF